MAAGVIRNFLVQAPTPGYFPLIYRPSGPKEVEEEKVEEERVEEKTRERDDEEDEEEEDEEVVSEAQEEEEECLEEVLLHPAPPSVDVTKQLLRFADLISRDVQRYFGHCSNDQDACDIYSDSVSMTTSGRLRYYDDLLRIAKAGSPEEQENSSVSCGEGSGARVARGNSGLGPLAELFNQQAPIQGRPMIKRHLPLSFWTEPIPCCSLVSFTSDVGGTPLTGGAHTDANTQVHYNTLQQHTHTLDNSQPDFSDLLANWDPNPELSTHTLTEH